MSISFWKRLKNIFLIILKFQSSYFTNDFQFFLAKYSKNFYAISLSITIEYSGVSGPCFIETGSKDKKFHEEIEAKIGQFCSENEYFKCVWDIIIQNNNNNNNNYKFYMQYLQIRNNIILFLLIFTRLKKKISLVAVICQKHF